METPRKYQHRRLIVEGQFQFKYSLMLASIGFFFCLIIGIGLIVLLKYNYDFLVDEGVLQSPAVLQHVTQEETKLFLVFFVLAVVVVVLFFYSGLYVTNRFVGPVKALTRELNKLRAGDLSAHLKLRNHDELQRLADVFNESMQNLRDQNRLDIELAEEWKSWIDSGQRKNQLLESLNDWIEKKKKMSEL